MKIKVVALVKGSLSIVSCHFLVEILMSYKQTTSLTFLRHTSNVTNVSLLGLGIPITRNSIVKKDLEISSFWLLGTRILSKDNDKE